MKVKHIDDCVSSKFETAINDFIRCVDIIDIKYTGNYDAHNDDTYLSALILYKEIEDES